MTFRHRARSASLLGLAAASALIITSCGNPFDASGEESGAVGSAAPSFGEIRDEMFEAMLSAESVTITAEVAAGEADLDEIFADIDSDEMGDLSISGALDGYSSQMSFSAGEGSFAQLAFGGSDYFRGEDFASLLVSELDEDVADVVDEELVTEIIGEQWVQFPGDAEGVFSAEEFLTTWQEQLSSEELAQMSAEETEHDGEQVWVFAADDGETEFMVAAEGEPYLLSLQEAGAHYEFTQWDDSEQPDEPDEVITLDEIYEAIAEDQGWDPEELEDMDEDQAAAFANA